MKTDKPSGTKRVRRSALDREVDAIRAITIALKGMEPAQQQRVMASVVALSPGLSVHVPEAGETTVRELALT